jgi:hypothetical protein
MNAMDFGFDLAIAKSLIVEGIGLASLVLAGVALVLIEIWGIKKIWRLMNGHPRRRPL